MSSIFYSVIDTFLYVAEYVYYNFEYWIYTKLYLRLYPKPKPEPVNFKISYSKRTFMIAIAAVSAIYIVFRYIKRRILPQAVILNQELPMHKCPENLIDSPSNELSTEFSPSTLFLLENDSFFSKEIFKACNQSKAVTFQEAFGNHFIKPFVLAETSFSLVLSIGSAKNRWVAKIIPINFSTTGMTSEILIAKQLLQLRKSTEYHTDGFVRFLGAKCIRDSFPKPLLDLYESNNVKNPRPLLGFFLLEKTYIMLRLGLCGTRLLDVAADSLEQLISVVLQVIWSVAIAERAVQFEHRDLQIDNILLRSTPEKFIKFIFEQRDISVKSYGVKASITDFGFSRSTISAAPVFFDVQRVLKSDIVEDRSSMGFDFMRGVLENNWAQFAPETNVAWVWSFLLEIDSYMMALDFNESSRNTLKELRTELSTYKSLAAFVEHSHVFNTLQKYSDSDSPDSASATDS